ncbi:MAG: hypothetical protein R3308_05990, partial [Thiohalobacterales bacterium]|nr:hypothetical protein [Thiohalobacterales bacterium]
FRHSIPYRLSDNGHNASVAEPALIEEIAALGKLKVHLGDWEAGENDNEREARVYVSSRDFGEVLRRLARASAALFIDRYHRPVDYNDIDWDELEFHQDFQRALDHCGLARGDIAQDAWREIYVNAMRQETRRLAASGESPPVEPE